MHLIFKLQDITRHKKHSILEICIKISIIRKCRRLTLFDVYRQQVSSTPAIRMDVVNLQEQLDMKLQQRQARETGICPARRELYTQCFDELIRQVIDHLLYATLLLSSIRFNRMYICVLTCK